MASISLSQSARRAPPGTPPILPACSLRIERIDPCLGIEAVRIVAVRAEPLGATALGAMLTGEESAPDLGFTVDRLAGRIGEAALFRTRPVESDVPERGGRPDRPAG